MKNKFAVALTTVTLGMALFTGTASANHPVPEDKSECKNGGFSEYIVGGGDTSQRFKNQGECIRFVNTGKG